MRLRQNGVEKTRVRLIMARTFEYYVAGDRQFEIVSLDESVELSVKYFYARPVLFVGFPFSVFGMYASPNTTGVRPNHFFSAGI